MQWLAKVNIYFRVDDDMYIYKLNETYTFAKYYVFFIRCILDLELKVF